MEYTYIAIEELEENKGQIKNVPANPRKISKERLEALKESIIDTPELLEARRLIVYPLNGKYVVIGGNQRFKACQALLWDKAPCVVLSVNTPYKKLKKIALKDNVEYGEWDEYELKENWDKEELKDWGVEINWEEDVKKSEDIAEKVRKGIEFNPLLRLELECDNEEMQKELYNEMKERGIKCRVLTL